MFNIYSPFADKKEVDSFKIFDNKINLLGADKPSKFLGASCDVFWVNEALDVMKSIFNQQEQRCRDFWWMDYNPSISDHWIYNNVCKRDDVDFLHTTFKDNPFVSDSERRKILSYEPTEYNKLQGTDDDYMWKVYGLGERASLKGLVFPTFNVIDEMPDMEYIYGLDWGYTNDPTAIVKVGIYGVDQYVDELVYQTGMMNNIVAGSLNSHGLQSHDIIWADSAEPKSIAEVSGYGFNIKGAEKGADSVNAGLQLMKQHRLNVTKRSTNLIKELRNYKWHTDKDGKTTNKPVDAFNHAIDALRYAVWMHFAYKKKEIFSSVI
jgi:phage terminase large subunit